MLTLRERFSKEHIQLCLRMAKDRRKAKKTKKHWDFVNDTSFTTEGQMGVLY